jgi:hypothetical protein
MNIVGMQPTTVDTESYLDIVANSIGNLILKVYDTNGRMAKVISSEVSSGLQQLNINVSDLSDGTYVLNAFNGDIFLKAIKFIKM